MLAGQLTEHNEEQHSSRSGSALIGSVGVFCAGFKPQGPNPSAYPLTDLAQVRDRRSFSFNLDLSVDDFPS